MVMPMSYAPIVTVIGGSGFLGRYVANQMAKRGWMVRVAVRRPNDAHFVMTYGTPGQLLPVQCNIRDEDSTRAAIRGAQAVVNCVGTFDARGRNSFGPVHVDGAARVARIAAEEGVEQLVHVSALGAAEDSPAEYGRTKFAGEKAVSAAFPRAIILRPSVLFGTEDNLFKRFAGIAMVSPVIPIVGGGTRFQPVWAADVAGAAARATGGEVPAGTYELGGPNTYTLREIVRLMLRTIRRRRIIFDMPFGVARLLARCTELLPSPPLTRDQVEMLTRDNVVSPSARGFEALGIQPSAPEGLIGDYLVAFRKYGQYNILHEHRGEGHYGT